MRNLPLTMKLAYILLKVANDLGNKRSVTGAYMKTYHIKNRLFFAAEKNHKTLNYIREHVHLDSQIVCPFSTICSGQLDTEYLLSIEQWLKHIDIEHAPKHFYFDFRRYVDYDHEYYGSRITKKYFLSENMSEETEDAELLQGARYQQY